MLARKCFLACAMLGIASLAFGSGVDGITIVHHEPLERLTLHRDGIVGNQKTAAPAPVTVSFDALGRSFDLELQPNAGLLMAMAGSELSNSIVPYRGRIAGSPGSWARIVIVDGMPAGLVWDGSDLYAIEVPGDSVVDTTAPLIYRLQDMVIAPGALSCAGGAVTTDGGALYDSLVGNLKIAMAQALGAVSQISIGAIGDSAFTAANGDGAEAAIMTRLSNVDGIYSEQLGVQINVPIIETFTASNDPFTDTTDPSALLEKLSVYRQGTPSQNSQGLTHLYTGQDLDGSTVGIAYQGVLCRPDVGAGLSEGNGSATLDSLVAAHEIGHNFNAPHDGVPGLCESAPDNFIMGTTLNNSTLSQFSACSITQMQSHMAGKSCITALPNTDIAIAFNGPAPSTLLGNAATLTFDVVNNGTLSSDNVVVDLTLPINVTFLAASDTPGGCTNGAGSVSCQLGNIAGGSATTVTVSVDTTAVGVGQFDATVTADADDNSANNQAAVQLTVEPAVNLVVNVPTSSQVALAQSTNISAELENQSILDATAVTLSIALDGGLRAESASWSIGTCSVADRQVDCTAGRFDAQSSSTLSMEVTGLTSGVQNYTVTLASTEADADPDNNSVAGTVRVNSDTGGSDESGGGSLNLIFLALLACARFCPPACAAVRRTWRRP
ncbi:MAG: M12 family metallo-peptidase [Gammaproteobacteria bacterium]|nr:M12 family metallo-peptidase [Gammaproteobacteria bacterium]